MTKPACWSCGSPNDDYTAANDAPGPDRPFEGAVGVCLYCAAISIYTGNDLEMRAPTPAELAEVMADQHIVKVVQAIHAMNASK
jgi:hypothetical protein